MADLITLTDAKTYLSIAHSDDDALLVQLITAASAAAEKYAGRNFAPVTAVIDKLDGGVTNLMLSTAPVRAITSIIDLIDGTTLSASEYNFDAATGLVWRADATLSTPRWGAGKHRWQIIYNGGFATTPDDVRQAVLLMVAARSSRRESLKSESIGDWSYTTDGGIPSEAAALLEPYRSRAI